MNVQTELFPSTTKNSFPCFKETTPSLHNKTQILQVVNKKTVARGATKLNFLFLRALSVSFFSGGMFVLAICCHAMMTS